MKKPFRHQALRLDKEKEIIFTALSKHYFYYRMFICQYVLKQNAVPLNPFMIFDYFLLDTVKRDIVREANNNLVKRSDKLWVFGPVSNGVLAEIRLAKKMNIPIKYFTIDKPHKIVAIKKISEVEMEDEVQQFRSEL
jgi:hypothetical protein